MPCRTAGNNINLLKVLNLLFGDFHTGQVDSSIFDHRIQGILDSFRLLMDFFHHEMLKTALFSCFCIPFNLGGLLFDFIAVQVIEMRLTRRQLCKLKVADVIHIASVFQNCRDIRSHISFTIRNTDNHRAILTRHPDLARIIPEHQLKRIGTAYTNHRLGNGINRTEVVLLIIVVHQLDDHFGIRLAVERIAMLQQFFFQFSIVLDDAVMYANDLRLHCAGTGTTTVTGNMRMRIRLARLTVGCPTGMANTTGSFQCLAAICFLDQIGQTAFCFHDLCQCFSIPDSQSSRVISSILQFRQAIQQDRCRLSISCKSNDSTHRFCLSYYSFFYDTFPLTQNDSGHCQSRH